ncbi:MAG: FUSC family protein [Terracidiphilus sp.]
MKSLGQLWSRLRTQSLALARQMDWFRGLRAAVALCTPLVLGDLAGIPNLGWAGLGGFEAILSDTGGPYRTRMSSLATLSLGGAVGLFLGSLCGGTLHWALPVTVLFCFLWSYLAVLGQPFSSAGILVQVIFICGIGAPTSSFHEALTRSLLLLAGGAWAALLSLFLWPLDAYRPARTAVSACYEELASFLASLAELSTRNQQPSAPQKSGAPSFPRLFEEKTAKTAGDRESRLSSARFRQTPALWHRLAQHHQYRIRRAVEQGWQAVASIRAEHQTETAQGHHLVVLLENADLLIARTIALAEHLEAQAASPGSVCLDRGLSSLADLRSAELWVASILVRRGQTAGSAQAKRLEMQRLPYYLEGCLTQSDPSTRFLLAQVTEAAALLETAIESAALLRLGKTPAFKRVPPIPGSVGQFAYVYARLAELRQSWNPARILDQLAANFTRKSLLLRHAARVALVCGLDVTLILLLHINHGYWLLMTSLIVLQPHVSGTMRRGLERIGGTVGGGILAALLAVALHSQLATAAVLLPLALLALAVLPVSYAAFAFFITPAFVLAWLPYSGDWQLALIRTANTIAGALISVLAMTFLFPAWERDRAPQFLRASIAADRRYLAQLAENWQTRSRSSRLLANARRAAGLAHNDTEESLERLLAETWPRRRPFAQFVAAFVTYLRRFAQSVTTLTALDGEWAWKQSGPVQSRLELLDRRLQWLEGQTGAHLATLPWPQPGFHALQPAIPPQDHPGERQLERLERQAEVLHRQLQSLREHGWLPGVPQP